MTDAPRNPHAGEPFADDDATIAAALEDVSVPALLCSLVHMTGDPAWIRGDVRPRTASLIEFQGGLTADEQATARARALPAIAAYRDGGCEPRPVGPELVDEMMAFLALRPVEGSLRSMLLEDLQLEGGDSGAIEWGDEVPADVRAASSVVVVGCGESGILAGIRLQQAGLPFTIVEKNAGPGGTWWENRYPGARVDVGSHQYCYSFEPADHWSEYYCQQPELRRYFTDVLDRHGLREHTRFETTVSSATWDDATGRWRVEVVGPDGATDVLEPRFLITAVGSLNLPRMPEIPGMDDFAGPSFHSARWPDGLDLTGKRFTLIGAGASGFQVVPAVAGRVGHLAIFQRTAQWIFPNPLYYSAVPPGDRWALRHLPFYGRWFRFIQTYPGLASGTEPFRVDPTYDDPEGRAISTASAGRREQLTGWMHLHLDGRPDLVEKVVPPYPASGKRILQDDGTYLRTLRRDDVELVRTGIERIVPEGVVTVDGVLHEADVICYATGFRHNEFLAPMDVRGRDGITLRERWGEEPTAYLGITVPGFPNLFCLYGPGTNLAHSASLFFHSEFQVHHAMDAIHQVLAAGAASIEVRPEVHDEYAERHQREISQLVWAHPAIRHSHYKNAAGKVFTLSPWPLDLYWRWTRTAEPDDYLVR